MHNPMETFSHAVVLLSGLYLVFGIARFNNAAEAKAERNKKSHGWPIW